MSNDPALDHIWQTRWEASHGTFPRHPPKSEPQPIAEEPSEEVVVEVVEKPKRKVKKNDDC